MQRSESRWRWPVSFAWWAHTEGSAAWQVQVRAPWKVQPPTPVMGRTAAQTDSLSVSARTAASTGAMPLCWDLRTDRATVLAPSHIISPLSNTRALTHAHALSIRWLWWGERVQSTTSSWHASLGADHWGKQRKDSDERSSLLALSSFNSRWSFSFYSLCASLKQCWLVLPTWTSPLSL